MSNFGIKSAGAAHNEKQKDERESLEWQVKNLLPYVESSTEKTRINPMFIMFSAIDGIRKANIEKYKRLAVNRFVDGHKEHGVALFDMSDSDLREAYDEEIADAIVYRAEMLRRVSVTK